MGKRRNKKRQKQRELLENVSLSQNNNNENTDFPFSIQELGICLKILKEISNNKELLKHSNMREIRKALDPLVQIQVEKYQNKQQPPLKRQKISINDEKIINSTKLRAERMKHLEKLNEEGKEDVLRVLDGVGIDHSSNLLLTNSSSDQLQLPVGECNVTISDCNDNNNNINKDIYVENPLKCYICKDKYTKLHFYYDQLCANCAELNYKKRTETVDMKDKICLVTGARVKIGYRCALKLLRCNAIVIGTTRFPADALSRFEKENDFNIWKHRIHIFGLDFRDIGSLELFCQFLKSKFNRLDVIINNACQTIRRPPAYYQHLLDNEKKYQSITSIPKETQSLLKYNFDLINEKYKYSSINNEITNSISSNTSNNNNITTVEELDDNMETIESHSIIDNSISSSSSLKNTIKSSIPLSSADMTQIELIPEDKNYSTSLFPTQVTDINQQQVDLRTKNSWMLKLDEVSTPELAEVMLINAMAPTIINSKLKTLMEFDSTTPKFIVNVSAMEGKFYRYKSDTHPHTNMAKAALNMMTRTSAQDYKKKNIYMTAVDTGWINDEKPLVKAVNHMKKHNFQTPLDEIDAAGRVLDPIIAPLLDLAQGRKFNPPWGIFLKDYTKCEW